VETLLVTLHVLAVVIAVGPLLLAPFAARRGIVRRSPEMVRTARALMIWAGVGSLIAALLGVFALSQSTAFDFRTPWVIVSLTLYVIAFVLTYGYGVPALRRAAHMVDEGVLSRPDVSQGEDEPPTTLTATAADLLAKERLDAISGRVAGTGLLLLLVFVVIVIMMTAKPF
jgi:hypothetical protein